jgi:hypothetical protein
MASIRSAPGYVNIYELIYLVGKGLAKPAITRISPAEFGKAIATDDYQAYSMFDFAHPNIMDYLVEKQKYPLPFKLLNVKIAIRDDQRYQLLKINTVEKVYPDQQSFMQDTLEFLVLHQCRSMLSAKQFKSYVLSDYAYYELPGEFWSYDIHWYRLLIDGAACGDVGSIGKFYGNIYFKEEEIRRSSATSSSAKSPSTTSSLINLSTYSTPWLQVLAAIYDEYGKEKLAQVAKSSIESFSAEYITKHNLDISSSDIPFLAKFIRLAEQKEGRKYHAIQKLKKVNK